MTNGKQIHLHIARSTPNGFDCSFVSVNNRDEADSALADIQNKIVNKGKILRISDELYFRNCDVSVDIIIHKFVCENIKVILQAWEVEDTGADNFISNMDRSMKQTLLEQYFQLKKG